MYANFEINAIFELQSRFYDNLSCRKYNRALQASSPMYTPISVGCLGHATVKKRVDL